MWIFSRRSRAQNTYTVAPQKKYVTVMEARARLGGVSQLNTAMYNYYLNNTLPEGITKEWMSEVTDNYLTNTTISRIEGDRRASSLVDAIDRLTQAISRK